MNLAIIFFFAINIESNLMIFEFEDNSDWFALNDQ